MDHISVHIRVARRSFELSCTGVKIHLIQLIQQISKPYIGGVITSHLPPLTTETNNTSFPCQILTSHTSLSSPLSIISSHITPPPSLLQHQSNHEYVKIDYASKGDFLTGDSWLLNGL